MPAAGTATRRARVARSAAPRPSAAPPRAGVQAGAPLAAPAREAPGDRLGPLLQRSCRLRAGSVAGPLLQRYQYVAPSVWRDGPVAPRFPSQDLVEDDFSATPTSTAGAGVRPTLKVSDDGDLALQSTSAEAKTFYATAAKRAESNRKLADVGSAVRLERVGPTLEVPRDPTLPHAPGDPMNTLEMLQPQMDAPVPLDQVRLGHHECVEVMKAITRIGSSDKAVAVLQGGGARSEQHVTFDDAKLRIADEVRRGHAVGQAAGALQAGHGALDMAATGRDYGRLSAADHATRSAALGVNEYAGPDVGEAYGTFTVGAPGTMHIDYTAERAQPGLAGALASARAAGLAGDVDTLLAELGRLTGLTGDILEGYVKAHVWNSHYAAVVARSGADAVTLENYNRERIVAWQMERIHANLVRQVAAFRNAVAGKGLKGVLAPIREGVHLAVDEAAEALASIQNLQAHQGRNAPEANKETKWYFAMFGPARETLRGGGQEDQSFHAAMVALGDFANPLTLRLRRETTPEGWERLAEQMDVELTKDAYASLHAVPATAGAVDVERATLLACLAYANAHADEAGRRSRVESMRAAVGAAAGRPGPNRELARHVAAKLAPVRRSLVVR